MLSNKLETNLSLLWKGTTIALIAAVFVLIPEMAYAIADFDTKLCDVQNAILGTPAKVIATLAIIFLGIGAFFGKLNWGTALLFAAGIIAVFASVKVVEFLDSSGVASTC